MTSTFRNILLLCVCWAGVTSAQDEQPPQTRQRLLSMISFEALPFFSADSSTALVNIHYRIREDFFVVLRNTESLKPNDFVARGDLLIELQTEQGISVARDFHSIYLRKPGIPPEDVDPADLLGSISFRVPPGTYSVVVNLEDRQSERSFLSKDRTVTIRSPKRDEFDISRPILVQPAFGPNDSTAFTALNQGNNVFFGGAGGILHVATIPFESTIFSIRHTITLQPDITELGKSEFRGSSFMTMDGLATLESTPGDTLSILSRPVRYVTDTSKGNWKTIYVPLPLERLHPGRAHVKLECEIGSTIKSFETSFRVLWPNMPIALKDLDLAVDALKHIASDEEMEAFRTFSKSNYVQKFFEFWNKKDPDTTTAFNELMVEYYRRVDAANRQYSTANELNGYKTDRGRIYILYGSPGDSRRLFSPGGPPKEVWTYPNLKRRFVFEDQRRIGNYVLVSVENL